jgi:hypothetical protein
VRLAKELAKMTDSFMERTKLSEDTPKAHNKSLNKVSARRKRNREKLVFYLVF